MEDQLNIIKNIIEETIHEKQIELDKIILFGSRARGDFRTDSDYDVLIVIKNDFNIQEKIKISSLLRKKLAKKFIDADIIIKTIADIEYYRDKSGSIVESAYNEGSLL